MLLSAGEWRAVVLTLELAAVSTTILLALGTPIALWLANTRGSLRAFAEALIALPLVLPPTVLGFYLLISFAPDSPLGALWYNAFGHDLAFSFSALVLGSCIYSMPFVVQPLQQAFAAIPADLHSMTATLGASPWDRFWTLTVPLSKRAFMLAGALAFAHTLGEFGVVLMIGGSIPGETQVLSIALYEHVENMNYPAAHRLALLILATSLIMLFTLYRRDGWRLGAKSSRLQNQTHPAENGQAR
ncbi:MAG: molybdate ABC transporter permease subunit [Pseudomonadota bacterium]